MRKLKHKQPGQITGEVGFHENTNKYKERVAEFRQKAQRHITSRWGKIIWITKPTFGN
jgi:hypothetical protein